MQYKRLLDVVFYGEQMERARADEYKGKVDFGIITIREDEFAAVNKRLPTQVICEGKQTYSLSKLQTTNNDEYLIAVVRCPEQGTLVGQSVATRLIDDLDPQWILVVGIGGCVPDNEYTLGDVVLASRVHDFCVSASVENGTTTFHVRGGAMHPNVETLVASIPIIEQSFEKWNESRKISAARPKIRIRGKDVYGDDEWQSKVKSSLRKYFGKSSSRKIPKVVTGSIASSDVLVKDTKLVSQWQQFARHLVGIEMEMAGVYQSAHDNQKPVLAIRGISDIVGYKRSPEWTEYACHSAAALTLALLKFRPIKPLSEEDGGTKVDLPPPEPAALIPSAFAAPPVDIAPLQKREQLFTNLLAVSFYPDKLYIVNTEAASRADVWNLLREKNETTPQDWVYHGKVLYAFHDFSDPVWTDIIEGQSEAHDTANWAETDDIPKTNVFIELLKGSLREFAVAKDLAYRHKKPLRFLYYAPTEDLSPRIVVTMSMKREGGHTVFKGYVKKNSDEVMYYRHHAFRFEFEKIEGNWFLQITPTYHYTKDGQHLFFFYEDLISGIKREENNEAVFRQVLFWSEVLKNTSHLPLTETREYPFIKFGELLQFHFDFGVNDDVWKKKESAGGHVDDDDQGSLFG